MISDSDLGGKKLLMMHVSFIGNDKEAREKNP